MLDTQDLIAFMLRHKGLQRVDIECCCYPEDAVDSSQLNEPEYSVWCNPTFSEEKIKILSKHIQEVTGFDGALRIDNTCGSLERENFPLSQPWLDQ